MLRWYDMSIWERRLKVVWPEQSGRSILINDMLLSSYAKDDYDYDCDTMRYMMMLWWFYDQWSTDTEGVIDWNQAVIDWHQAFIALNDTKLSLHWKVSTTELKNHLKICSFLSSQLSPVQPTFVTIMMMILITMVMMIMMMITMMMMAAYTQNSYGGYNYS